jgi:hypothetical protein
MRIHSFKVYCLLGAALLAVGVLVGCSKQSAKEKAAMKESEAALEMDLCNFIGGPDNAKVTVLAFYPGRHEDTLAAIKGILKKFPQDVRVEIVDWRMPEGMKRRDEAGLTCAGVVIDGKNAFDITVDGKTNKVLFVRGIDGEWTAADLEAAVRQELAAKKDGEK